MSFESTFFPANIWGALRNNANNDVWLLSGSADPTSGTSGTAAGLAGPGSLYMRTSNGAIYANTNTKASPTWTVLESSSGGTLINPLIQDGLTASGSVANDFSGSTGAFKTSSGANQLSGSVTITDATTPSLTTASGKTNTGFLLLNGKTSGSFKILPADATAQAVILAIAAQTVGGSTITIPDQAGASSSIVLTTLAQTLTNKTLTSPTLTTPAIGVATGASLAVTGALSSSSVSAGIGYATGAGLTATQSTNKSTTVTNTATAPSICGTITMNNAALNAGVVVSFTFTNSAIAATDMILVTHVSGGTVGAYIVSASAGAGSAVFTVTNISAGNLSEAVVLRYAVIKAVVS